MTGDDAFAAALEKVLVHEGQGQFSDDKVDPGGPTKWGISLRFLQSIEGGDVNHDGAVDHNDVRELTREQAAAVYRSSWWDRYKYGSLASQLGAKVFDISVNTGPSVAHRALQRALRACQLSVVEDGILGPKTRAACNSLVSDGLLPAFRSEVAGYYRALVVRHPDMKKYIRGWLNRAYD